MAQSEGDPVNFWVDDSIYENDLTQSDPAHYGTFRENAINGLPAVEFTGGDHLFTDTNFASPCTVFIVARQLGTQNARVLAGKNNNWLLGWHGGKQQQAFFEGWVFGPTTSPASTTAASDDWQQYTAVCGGSFGSVFRLNRGLLAQNYNGMAGPDGLMLGGRDFPGSPEFSDCQVAEVIIYAGVLSDGEIERVENYLASKYAL